MIYIVVILAIGVSNNVEGFAKSIFNQASLQRFNKLNTGWLVVYFFVLLLLQRFGLTGVMIAQFLFFGIRVVIAIAVVDSINAHISWRSFVTPFMPGLYESISYGAALAVSWFVNNKLFPNRPTQAFALCLLIGICHFAAYIYFRRSLIRQFKTLVKTSKVD